MQEDGTIKIAYKLTDGNMRTHGHFQWELDKWYEIAEGDRGESLCSKSWFHLYADPLLAILLNSIHAGFGNPRLFKVEYDGETTDDAGLKMGATQVRFIREMALPQIDQDTRVRWAILCALEVYQKPLFVDWAQAWLSGKDRTADTARATAHAAVDATSWATHAAADATHAAHATHATDYAATDAHAARHAAEAAVDATHAADTSAANRLPLIELAKQAIRDEAAYQERKGR